MNMNAWPCTCALSLRPVGAAPHQTFSNTADRVSRMAADDCWPGERWKRRPRRDHRVFVIWVRPGGKDRWWKGRRGRWMGMDGGRKEYLHALTQSTKIECILYLRGRIDRFCYYK
ncbi:hypothetical protein EDB89DRAFT_2005097, partial [Lactarius sanguifluus]